MNCTRRHFFSRFARSLAAEAIGSIDAFRLPLADRAGPHSRAPAPHWLRPPGALPEPQFRSTCTRCTACQEACPYDSIRRLGPEFGDQAGTPAIIPEESPCYLCEDMPCISACQPRALLPVERHDVTMGRAHINAASCYLASGQPCDYCVTRCPIGSKAVRFGSNGLPMIREAGCTGCGVCTYLCPAAAITIEATSQIQKSTNEAHPWRST